MDKVQNEYCISKNKVFEIKCSYILDLTYLALKKTKIIELDAQFYVEIIDCILELIPQSHAFSLREVFWKMVIQWWG